MRRILLLLLLAFTLAWPQGETTWTAVLEPARSAQLCALIAGQVVRVAVQEGALVHTGDTLICLDDTDLRLAEEEHRLAYLRAQRFLDRVQQLNQRSLLSAQELEDAQYQAATAHLRWQRAQLELEHTVVLAPFSGQVADLQVQPGSLTSPRQVLCQVLVAEDLKAVLYLPADQVATLQVPQLVMAQVTITGRPLAGRLVHLSPLVDPQSGSCKAEVLFPGAGPRLKPGTLIRIYLPTPQPLQGGKER
jgi:RND family efflux transporter MFP subunit